jgi:carotenoid cleavage dioxygenase-like enzyme
LTKGSSHQELKDDLSVQLGDMKGVMGVIILMVSRFFAWAFPPVKAQENGPLGNTALVFHGKKLLALMEGGYPFLLRVCRGVLASVGVYTYGGTLKSNLTAHPKLDPETNVLHAFSYRCAAIDVHAFSATGFVFVFSMQEQLPPEDDAVQK